MTVIEGHRVSPQQARLCQLQQTHAPLMAALTIAIEGHLDPVLLHAALSRAIQEHEGLRTRLPRVPGKEHPLQVVDDTPDLHWQIEEASTWEAALEAADRIGTASIPLDLEKEHGLYGHLIVCSQTRHLLIIRIPAIHVDYQSLNNLFESLGREYLGPQQAAQEEPTQYLDFSEWLQELATEETDGHGKEFWARQNLDRLPVTAWAGERPEPLPFCQEKIAFQPELHSGLKPEATALAAAWYAFLARYLGPDGLVLHHYYHGRIDSELNSGVGLFASILPLHLPFSGQQTFAGFLSSFTNHLHEAETNAIFQPPDSGLHHTPGLHFEYFRHPESMAVGPAQWTCLRQEVPHGPYQLKLSVAECTTGLAYQLFFDSGTIAPLAAERLIDAFTDFLRQLDPEQPLARIGMGGHDQYRQLVTAFNQTGSGYTGQTTLDQWFSSIVAQSPEAPAIQNGATVWTFAELEAQANRLAHYLTHRGIGPESVVPVCLDRDAVLIAALLGVLKTGAAYIGIDPQYPSERVALMAQNTSIALVNETTRHLFPAGGPPELCVLDAHMTLAKTQPATPLKRHFEPGHPAYIIYTSGSTGVPKGVVITHASAVNYVQWCIQKYLDKSLDGSPVHSSIGFDLTVTSIFPALLTGKKVVMVADEAGIDGLQELLAEAPQFGLIKLTPSHLRLLQMEDTLAKTQSGTALVIGGEALYAQDIAPFLKTPLKLFNEYGPTEATVGCCVHPINVPEEGAVSIGTPIDGMRCYALDVGLNPVGYYQPGELYIAGVGLARGYRGQPGLTASRFLPNPFAEQPGSRMYKTGDLVHFLGQETPQLYFLGRNDHQVKVRGFRVELKDIECALKKLEGIAEAVVLYDTSDSSPRLIAYYVASKALKINQIRAFLENHLPQYMIPSHFISLQRIPLTVNGKTDLEALPKPDSQRPDLTNEYAAPRDGLEEVLSNIWQKVLNLDQIGIHDNFFALGGDSIRSVRVAAEANTHGLTLTVQNLFEAPTIAKLAEMVQASKDTEAQAETPPSDGFVHTQPFSLIKPGDRELLPPDLEDAYPLSAVQMGMLFHMQITKDSPSPPDYHNLNSFEIQVPFDPVCFQEAVDAVCQRHPILRTSFDLTRYSEPLQLVHRDARILVHWEDLRGMSMAEQRQRIDAFIRRENFSLVDITQAPLVALTIQQTADDRIWLHYKEPHAIADGWSTNFNLVEIFENYLTLKNGEPLKEREPLKVTYRDFIDMERKTRQSPQSRAFWEDLMTQVTPLELPPLQSSSAAPALADHKHYSKIPAPVMTGLHHVSAVLGVPFKSILLAAHAKVMALFTGLDQITTGLVFNGRPEVPGGDQVRGLFLNTLPVPIPVRKGSWAALIRTVFDCETKVLPHRRFPVSGLQSVSGRKPSINVAFSMHHFHSANDILNSGNLAVTDSEDWSKTNYDLAVFFHRNEKDAKQMHLVVEGNLDRLSKGQLLRIVAYFQEVLARIATTGSDPEARHHLDHFLPPEEFRTLIRDWNGTGKEWQTPAGLHQLVETAAMTYPDRPAVVFENRRLTYTQLEQEANQLAHYLTALGITAESRVGLALYRSPAMIIAMLAIMKCGAAYVPLDPDYPASRLEYMTGDAGISCYLTSSAIHQAFHPSHQVTAIVLDEAATETAIGQCSGRPLHTVIHGKQAAYMIYTSGSTGNPKGTIISHEAILNRILWMRDDLQTSPSDRILQKTPFSFDVSVWEFFLPLTNGAQLVFARPGGHKDNRYLVETIRDQGITTLHFVPSMLRHFLAEPSLDQLGTLKHIVCSGEALPSGIAAECHAKLDAHIHNLYGPTEAAVDVTAFRYSAGEYANGIPIGTPISNTQIYVLDRHANPLAIGASGEIHIGGINLARGYCGKPALTAKSFVPDPFSSQPGMRLYKTGDQAYFGDDGNLYFLGRKDFQVKFRGFRIELSEIEKTINLHEDVQSSIVLVRRDQHNLERLVAYILPHQRGLSEKSGFLNALRHHLREKLPDYMVPAAFVLLEALPLTPNGKLDRRALPDPTETGVQSEAEYRAPSSPEEKILVAVWQEVLGQEKVGIDDNFFDLGGDSILSILIVAKAGAQNLQLTSTQIFEKQTIAKLAQVATQKTGDQIDQGPVSGVVPLTPIQSWFFGKKYAQQHHWNQSIFLLSKTSLDPGLMAQTARILMDHHDSLRTQFSFENGTVIQTVAPPGLKGVYHRVTLQSQDGSGLKDQLEDQVSFWQAGFDLTQGPLFKMVHFDTGPDISHRLLILAHHLVVDGISWRILLEDLETIYRQLIAGEHPQIPQKTTAFKAWADHWATAGENHLAGQLSLWSDPRRMDAAPLPRDLPAGDAGNLQQHARSIRVRLNQDHTNALLKEVPAAYGTRINEVLLCALGRVLQRWTGQALLLVDMETHGRQATAENIDISRTVGWFTAVYPMLLELGADKSLAAQLISVKEQMRALPDEGVGYGQLRYLSQNPEIAATLAHQPAAEVLFNYLGQFDHTLRTDSQFQTAPESRGQQFGPKNERAHLLDIDCKVIDGRLAVSWTYAETVHLPSTIRQLAEQFIAELEQMIGHCTSAEAGSLTPSDFPEANLELEELDDLVAKYGSFQE